MASCGVNGPFSPGSSLLTTLDHPSESAGREVDGYVLGSEEGGMNWLLKPSSVLVWTFMFCLTASDRMYGLNEEPTCSRFWVAMFHWQSIFKHSVPLMICPVPLYLDPVYPGPGYRAWIWPLAGFSSTAPTCMYDSNGYSVLSSSICASFWLTAWYSWAIFASSMLVL